MALFHTRYPQRDRTTVPFSTQDDGGDIVETSYMIQGLLWPPIFQQHSNT